MRARLYRSMLHYGEGLMLHTASSGPVSGLDTLHLLLDDEGISGVGEVRINIAYLNGYAPEEVVQSVTETCSRIDWSQTAEDLLLRDGFFETISMPVRMLIDIALHDLAARRAGMSVASRLGALAPAAVRHATNQTLFISTRERFLDQAQAYVDRGFRDLKVRVGAGGFAEDCERLQALRDRFGDQVKLAVDANGAWSPAEAAARLDHLARFDLAYVEQPIAAGNWNALANLADRSPIPMMLDESVTSPADVDRIVAAGGRLWAHLKLVKLGGITPALKAARQLRAANVPFMIGQMNEGGIATAAALHLAVATEPRFAELYGADGLVDDPASSLGYTSGTVGGNEGACGLGMTFDASKAQSIEEF